MKKGIAVVVYMIVCLASNAQAIDSIMEQKNALHPSDSAIVKIDKQINTFNIKSVIGNVLSFGGSALFIFGGDMFTSNLTTTQKVGSLLSAIGTGVNITGAKNIIKTKSILTKRKKQLKIILK
jgi:hypothetical protein